MKLSNDTYAMTLAYLGAKTKLAELLKNKKVLADQIAWLRDFLKPRKKEFVKKVRGKYKTRMTKIRRRRISPAGLEAMRKNAAKARAAKAAKNGAK